MCRQKKKTHTHKIKIKVDNPAGAGYSYDDLDNAGVYDEDIIAEDLYEFMQKFLR